MVKTRRFKIGSQKSFGVIWLCVCLFTLFGTPAQAAYVCIQTALTSINMTIDVIDGTATSSIATFTTETDKANTSYDVWISVAQANLDASNDVYLATNGGFSLPLDVNLQGNSGGNAVNTNPAALQTGAPSTARPTTGNTSDGDKIKNIGAPYQMTYTVTLTENTTLASTYPNIPDGSYLVTITANVALWNSSGNGNPPGGCPDATSSNSANSTVNESIGISSTLNNFSLANVDFFDGAATSNSGTVTVIANANDTIYDVWLSVAEANLDATNDVYITKNGADSLPIDVLLTGNSGANAVSANSAAIQTGAPSTAQPTSGNKSDGDAVAGTERDVGTVYTVTLTEDSDNFASYPSVPAGIYTVDITANIAHGD